MGTVKLKSVTIKGYRSCADTHMEVNDDLTVLIGKNGSGKTNIMKALMLLQKLAAGEYRIVDEQKEDLAHVQALCTIDQIEWELNVPLFIDRTKEEDIIITKNAVSIKKINHPSAIQIDIADLHRHYVFNGGESNINGVGEAQTAVIALFSFLSGTAYYSVSQFLDPAASSHYVTVSGHMLVSDSDLNSHDKFWASLYRLYQLNVDAFHNYMSIIGENGLGLVTDLSFQELVFDNNVMIPDGDSSPREGRVIWAFPLIRIDEMYLSSNQLSEGTFKMLALIFYLLNDYSQLMLIEEPEVGIHHRLIDSFMEIVQNAAEDKQIIVSTHSGYLLDRLKPENIIAVELLEGQGTKAQRISEVLSAEDYGFFKNYLQNEGNLGDYWLNYGFEQD